MIKDSNYVYVEVIIHWLKNVMFIGITLCVYLSFACFLAVHRLSISGFHHS